MKRDWNLIRKILQLIENNDTKDGKEALLDFFDWYGLKPDDAWALTFGQIENRKKRVKEIEGDKFSHHVNLMLEAGLIAGTAPENYEMTLKGYDLLEIIRSDDTWEKILAKYANGRGVFTLENIMNFKG